MSALARVVAAPFACARTGRAIPRICTTPPSPAHAALSTSCCRGVEAASVDSVATNETPNSSVPNVAATATEAGDPAAPATASATDVPETSVKIVRTRKGRPRKAKAQAERHTALPPPGQTILDLANNASHAGPGGPTLEDVLSLKPSNLQYRLDRARSTADKRAVWAKAWEETSKAVCRSFRVAQMRTLLEKANLLHKVPPVAGPREVQELAKARAQVGVAKYHLRKDAAAYRLVRHVVGIVHPDELVENQPADHGPPLSAVNIPLSPLAWMLLSQRVVLKEELQRRMHVEIDYLRETNKVYFTGRDNLMSMARHEILRLAQSVAAISLDLAPPAELAKAHPDLVSSLASIPAGVLVSVMRRTQCLPIPEQSLGEGAADVPQLDQPGKVPQGATRYRLFFLDRDEALEAARMLHECHIAAWKNATAKQWLLDVSASASPQSEVYTAPFMTPTSLPWSAEGLLLQIPLNPQIAPRVPGSPLLFTRMVRPPPELSTSSGALASSSDLSAAQITAPFGATTATWDDLAPSASSALGPAVSHRYSATFGALLVPSQDTSVQAALTPRALENTWPGQGKSATGGAVFAPVAPPYGFNWLVPNEDKLAGGTGPPDAEQDHLVFSYALPGTEVTLDLEVTGHQLFDDPRALAEGKMPLWQVERAVWHTGRAAHVAAPSSTSDMDLERHAEVDAELPDDVLFPLLDKLERSTEDQKALDRELKTEADSVASGIWDLDETSTLPGPDPRPIYEQVLDKHGQRHRTYAQIALFKEREKLHPSHLYFPPGSPLGTLDVPAETLPEGLRGGAAGTVGLPLVRFHRALRRVWRLASPAEGPARLLVREEVAAPTQRSPSSFFHLEWVPGAAGAAPAWPWVLAQVQPWLETRFPTPGDRAREHASSPPPSFP